MGVVSLVMAAACEGGASTATPPAAGGPTAINGNGTPTTALPGPTNPGGGEGEPVVITLAANGGEVSSGDDVQVEITVDPQGRGLSGVQVLLRYDPTAIRAVTASAGPLLGEGPVEAGPMINTEEGTFEYAAARVGQTEPPTTAGLFATLEFQVLEGAPKGGEIVLAVEEVTLSDEEIRAVDDVRIGEALRLPVAPSS